MPSTIPRVLQPPFSLAQLLSNNVHGINGSPVTLDPAGGNIVSFNLPPITADTIIWAVGVAEIQPGASSTSLTLRLDGIDGTIGALIDFFGDPGLFPRVSVPPTPGGSNTVLNVFGIGFAPVDMPQTTMQLIGFSGGDNSTVAANDGAMRVFVIRA